MTADANATAAVPSPASIASGEAPVWNGSAWVRSSVTKIATGQFAGIKNADVDAAAAIVYSKLSLASSIVSADIVDGTIVNADINASAAIAASKLASTVGYVYDRSTAGVDVQNSAVETSIYTKSIAGNDMGTNRMLRLTLIGDYLHNNAAGDTITFRTKFGGVTLHAHVASSLGANVGALRHPWIWEIRLSNLGAANSQFMQGLLQFEQPNATGPTTGIGTGNTAGSNLVFPEGISTLGSSDTTSAQTLDVTVQWSATSANDSWRLRYGVLELV